MKNNYFRGKIFLAGIFVLLASACNDEQKTDPDYQSETAGKTSIVCDKSIADLIQPMKEKFSSVFPQATVEIKEASAREAMRDLLAGNTKGIIIARPYLHDEDSLMKAFGVKPHERSVLAKDALVFFAQKNFSLDTLSKADLEEIFSLKEKSFRNKFPLLSDESVVAIADSSSSEYANLQRLVTNGNSVRHELKFFPSTNEVKTFVRNNPNAIGVGYLSQLVRDGDLKMLRIGFYSDSAKQYIAPKPVHQSYVTMEQYPYPVEIFSLLFENRRRQPAWGFFSYLATDANAQKFFLNQGIVPAYARIKIIEED